MTTSRAPRWAMLPVLLSATMVFAAGSASAAVALPGLIAFMTAFAAEPGPDDADAPKEFTKTDSGLKYRVLRKGSDKMPTAKNTVVCHYKGWLDNGKEFDSSYKRNEPAEFPLGGVIKGWTEGLQLIGEGGKIELEIPSQLGYGARGAGRDIPPNSTLHFIVELKKVK